MQVPETLQLVGAESIVYKGRSKTERHQQGAEGLQCMVERRLLFLSYLKKKKRACVQRFVGYCRAVKDQRGQGDKESE